MPAIHWEKNVKWNYSDVIHHGIWRSSVSNFGVFACSCQLKTVCKPLVQNNQLELLWNYSDVIHHGMWRSSVWRFSVLYKILIYISRSRSILFRYYSVSIVWKYTIIMDNQNPFYFQWRSIQFPFYTMAFYGFSIFFPVHLASCYY